MPDLGGNTTEGLTRREALKRGVAFGGALLWATPAVQAVGMSRALATETSGNCRIYCLRWSPFGGWSSHSGTSNDKYSFTSNAKYNSRDSDQPMGDC